MKKESTRSRAWDKTPEAQNYRDAYVREHYDQINIKLPAGFRERIDAAASEAGMSRTAFIFAAIREKMESRGSEE